MKVSLGEIIAQIRPKLTLRNVLFFVIPTSIIIAVLSPMIISHNRMGGLDWDIFFAYHEAIRRAILTYHQFPWWDPWISGGVPLAANPQNGIISIETPFILVFGTIWGMKLAATTYFITGFWGMYALLRELANKTIPKLKPRTKSKKVALVPIQTKTQTGVRLLLSYIWIFSTFITFHFFAGHFTFLLYLLTPWLFFLALKLESSWSWAVLFGLFTGFFINTNLHYITVQAIFLLGFWLIGVFILSKRKKLFITRLLAASVLILLLIAPKLYFSNVYVSQFAVPGAGLIQQVTNFSTLKMAFLHTKQNPLSPVLTGQLGWWEISAYVGITTMLLFAIAVGTGLYQSYKQKRINLLLVFFVAALGCLLIGLGPFARFSPYHILSHFPVFKSMQVPSRWFGWTLLFILLTIGQLKSLQKLAFCLLLIAAVELTYLQPIHLSFPYLKPQPVRSGAFEEYDNLAAPLGTTMGSNMYQAIISNYGEVRGYEPLLNRATFGIPPATCGINVGCQLVSSNAKVLSWSPNEIKLKRLGPGPIWLNENPSSYWLVNGKRLFAHDRVTEPDKKFIINDPSQYIDAKINPL